MIEPKMAPGDYADWSKEIPKELWEQIIVQAENPALLTTCKLFKDIIYDPSITLRKLEANFKDRFSSTFFKVKFENNIIALNEARELLIERLSTNINTFTKIEFKEQINLNYYTFTKVLVEEHFLNLIDLFMPFIQSNDDFHMIQGACSMNERIEVIHSILNKQNFSDVKKIKVLSWEKLTYIPKEINLFSRLETINLSGNKITILPEDFGENWTHLKEIDLGNNKLTMLPNDFGKNWKQLKQITLFSNKIDFLPSDFGSHWKELVFIRFGNNPLKLDENEFKKKTNENVRIYQ